MTSDAVGGVARSISITPIWMRASEFMAPDVPVLHHDGISPNDIVQGELGDCYLLSAMSVMAERPKRIEALFEDSVPNACGIYRVSLHPNGLPRKILIDDMFPCDPRTRRPIFSRGRGPELWVMLIEKAYAKIAGSYLAIDRGTTAKALFDLSGAPVSVTKVIPTTGGGPRMPRDARRGGAAACNVGGEDVALFQRMLDDHRRGSIICCSIPDDPSRNLREDFGLVVEHAYGLVWTIEFQMKDAAPSAPPIRLIQIRNPWAHVCARARISIHISCRPSGTGIGATATRGGPWRCGSSFGDCTRRTVTTACFGCRCGILDASLILS